MALIEATPSGLYCEVGGFFIDPSRKVDKAIVTHAHSDHARRGSSSYLVPPDGLGLLRARLGDDISAQTLPYGESLIINGVKVSLHPAGHILGSCMVRVEYQGEVWVISGDYKVHSDPTCLAMDTPPRCHVFISESTFGLPIYRWKPPHLIADEINNWWRSNQQMGRCSVLSAYAIGKSQRLLAGLDPSIGPIGLHRSIARYIPIYSAHGVQFPAWETLDPEDEQQIARFKAGGIIIASGSAGGSAWLADFGDVAIGNASGWMAVRGSYRRQNLDAGFVLSDHADWPGLLDTIKASGAERVGIAHGYTSVLTRYLNEKGIKAFVVPTHFRAEEKVENSDSPP